MSVLLRKNENVIFFQANRNQKKTTKKWASRKYQDISIFITPSELCDKVMLWIHVLKGVKLLIILQ